MMSTMDYIEHKRFTVIFGSITSLISQIHRGNEALCIGHYCGCSFTLLIKARCGLI